MNTKPKNSRRNELRTIVEAVKSTFVTTTYEPLYYKLYKKDNTMKYYRQYRKAQWDDLKNNQAIQARKLYDLLNYATTHIPQYKKMKKEKKIRLTKKNIIKDLRKFSILTKKELKDNFDKMYLPIPNLKHYTKSSGGSTGEPVKLIHDNEYGAHAAALTKLQFEWAGLKTGNTLTKLWGSQEDIMQEKGSTLTSIANRIKSVQILNAFSMDDEIMNQYIRKINRTKPKLILAYADAMFELSKHIEKNNIQVFSPEAIMTSAGTLYPEFRECIENAFQCPVFDRYGSREVGNVACECEKHEGLHTNPLTHYVEILNNELKPCKENETGDLYITLLDNYTMPLIRYKIGDLATYTAKKCSCGRGFPLIKNIAGRDTDTFLTRTGKRVPGEFFIHFIGVVFNDEGISKFQVIQKDPSTICIKAVIKNKRTFDNNKKKIETAIKNTMGEDCKVRWHPVGRIPPTKSGKYRYTIREF